MNYQTKVFDLEAENKKMQGKLSKDKATKGEEESESNEDE